MDLNRVQMFAQVVEQGSFTGAARALGLTKATVSRKIAELEADAGVQLLFRTTRALKLTEAGADYYNKVHKILADLKSAEDQLNASQRVIKGRLKIVCPIELGQLYFGRLFARFLLAYPDMSVEVELTNRKVDVIAEGVDIIFQITQSSDDRLQSYSLLNAPKTLMASPDYLRQFGTPKTPQELAKHKSIRIESAHIDGRWTHFDGKKWITTETSGQMSVNNVTLAREAAIEGLGITSVPTLIAQNALDNGELIAILEDFPMAQSKVIVSFPQRAYLPRKYLAFIEHLYAMLFEQWGELVLEVPDFIKTPPPN